MAEGILPFVSSLTEVYNKEEQKRFRGVNPRARAVAGAIQFASYEFTQNLLT